MATKTFYLSTNTATGASSAPQLNESNAGYSADSLGGWATGSFTASTPRYSPFAYSSVGSQNNQTTNSATDYLTSGSNTGPGAWGNDFFRTESAYTGTFASGTWAININMATDVGGNGTYRIKFRVWRSTSATGASPTLIDTFDNGSDFTPPQSPLAISWSAPSISLNNEYLFFQAEIVMQSAPSFGGGVNFRSSTVQTWTTTDFTAGAAATSLIIDPNAHLRHMLIR